MTIVRHLVSYLAHATSPFVESSGNTFLSVTGGRTGPEAQVALLMLR